jgi:hypothetical protein
MRVLPLFVSAVGDHAAGGSIRSRSDAFRDDAMAYHL